MKALSSSTQRSTRPDSVLLWFYSSLAEKYVSLSFCVFKLQAKNLGWGGELVTSLLTIPVYNA